ncbi:hypothetical protein NKJ81_20275 [Mesorhizobium sp. M0018]|uniref:hypothetical protein n=1 Tax=Mesorhizobium sp. M0018 TaxID=2956844 RepID=UPI0033383FB0
MTLDGFLGLIALFIAFYAIVSPVTRLRVQLHLAIQMPLAFLSVTLVLYFEFFSLLGQPCWPASKQLCYWLTFPADNSFTPQQAAFLVVFAWMSLALTLNHLLKSGPRALPTIGKIVQTLLYDHRFAELLDFIRPHLRLIDETARRQRLLQKVHDWLANADRFRRQKYPAIGPVEEEVAAEAKSTFATRGYEGFRRNIRWFAVFIPAQRKVQAGAENIARMLLRSEEFRRFVVTMRPDMAADLMAINLHLRYDFADKVFRDLIADSGSRLYQEIEQNQNLAGDGGYVIPEQNKLLHFLFDDANVARRLGAWKPVGDYVINSIRAGAKNGYTEYLNDRSDNFDEERWRDSTFVGIRYFDIMVHAAMRQGVPDHMWLFYLPLFVKELEEVYDSSGPEIDTTAEFPTRNARLIYEAFHVMGNWVRAIEYLDAASPHAAIAPMGEFSSCAIPVDAGVVLGNAMVTVVLSPRIGDTFAAYIHDCVLHHISALSRDGLEGRMRAILIRTVVAGGNRGPDARYGEKLKTFLAMTDHVLRGQVRDYVEAVTTTFPDPRTSD